MEIIKTKKRKLINPYMNEVTMNEIEFKDLINKLMYLVKDFTELNEMDETEADIVQDEMDEGRFNEMKHIRYREIYQKDDNGLDRILKDNMRCTLFAIRENYYRCTSGTVHFQYDRRIFSGYEYCMGWIQSHQFNKVNDYYEIFIDFSRQKKCIH